MTAGQIALLISGTACRWIALIAVLAVVAAAFALKGRAETLHADFNNQS